jgi:hypothetical protein
VCPRDTGQSTVGWQVNSSNTVAVIRTTWLNINLCVSPTQRTCLWLLCSGTKQLVPVAVSAVWGRRRRLVPLHGDGERPSVRVSHLETRWTNFYQCRVQVMSLEDATCLASVFFPTSGAKCVVNAWYNKVKDTLHLYLLTNLLTPWSRVLLEKPTGFQIIKKFPHIL